MYKELNLNATTLSIATAVKEQLPAKGPATQVIDNNFFYGQMPEGLNKETSLKYDAYRSDFVAGVTLASGEASITSFADDKKLLTTAVEAGMGADTLKVSFAREKSGKVMLGPSKGSTWQNRCAPTVTIKNKASSKTSQLSRIFSHIKVAAAK